MLREKDLNTLQENARKLGHTHDTDRFSMELEVERLKEDLRRAEDSLDRVKTDLNKKEIALGLREDALSDMVNFPRIRLAEKTADEVVLWLPLACQESGVGK